MPKGKRRLNRVVVVQIGIFPSGTPGAAIRLSLDAESGPQAIALDVASAVLRAIKKLAKRDDPALPAATEPPV